MLGILRLRLCVVARKVPSPVWWLCGLNLCLLVGLSVLTPLWRAPDEPNHADLVVGVRETRSYPAFDQRDVDAGIRGSFSYVFFGRRPEHLLAEEALPRGQHPSRQDLRAAGEEVDLGLMFRPGVANHMPQHPPGYYVVTAGAAEVVDRLLPGTGLGSFDREVAILRLLTLLAAVPLPLVAWWVAATAGASRVTAVAASVVPLGIPQLSHMSSVVNNDALSVLTFALATGLVVRVAKGRRDQHTLMVLGASIGFALFVKGSAIVLPPIAALALVFGAWRHSDHLVRHLRGLAVIGTTTIAFGGWWWMANIVRFGEVFPTIEDETRLKPYMTRPPGFEPSFTDWFGKFWFPMVRRYWGEFSWIDFALPRPALTAASCWVVIGLAVLAIGWIWRRGRPSELDPTTGVLLFLPSVALAVFFGLASYTFYTKGGFMEGVQGRYLFGGVVGLAVVVAAGWERILGRWTALAFFSGAVALQALAVRAMLDHWWGAADASLSERFDAWMAWSPWPSGLVAVVLVAFGIAIVGAAVALIRDLGRDVPADSPASETLVDNDRPSCLAAFQEAGCATVRTVTNAR